MAKKTRLSAIECKPIKDALCKAKYKSPGILARVLLEAFTFEDGNINSDWFVREKLCTKGSFTKLRDRIIKDQWIHFREDSKRYFPGIRLKPNLDLIRGSKAASLADIEAMDAKKADRSDLRDLDDIKADKSELERTKADLEFTKLQMQENNRKMQQIAEAIKDLQEAISPPDTPAKKKLREEKAQKIAVLSKN
jgi:hypothetical protein